MNNKGLKIVLVVLIVMVLTLGGFIIYEKTLKEDNNVIDSNNKVNNSIKSNDNKIDCKLDKSLVNKFIGTYIYEGEYVEEYKNDSSKYENLPIEATAYEKLTLKEDGSAIASSGNLRGGGYNAEGKWYISDNELIIINDTCKAHEISNDGEIVYANCQHIWLYSFEITDNDIVINSSNNSMVKVILNRVND